MICKGGKYSVPGSPRVPARRAGEDKDTSKAAVEKEGSLPHFSAGFLSPSEQPLGKIGAGASTADVN